MKDEEPKPPPTDWPEHIRRDVEWMTRPSATHEDRQHYAARILDMVDRVVEHEVAALKKRVRELEEQLEEPDKWIRSMLDAEKKGE